MNSHLPLHFSDNAQRVELEYGWELLVDPSGRMQREEAEASLAWRSARVGLSWNAQFDDLRDYMGAAWYRQSSIFRPFRTHATSCSSSVQSIISAMFF